MKNFYPSFVAAHCVKLLFLSILFIYSFNASCQSTNQVAEPVKMINSVNTSAHSVENVKVIESKEIIIVPENDSFPKFIDTGNPEQDQADYAARKQLWVKENEEAYKKMQKPIQSESSTTNPSKN